MNLGKLIFGQLLRENILSQAFQDRIFIKMFTGVPAEKLNKQEITAHACLLFIPAQKAEHNEARGYPLYQGQPGLYK